MTAPLLPEFVLSVDPGLLTGIALIEVADGLPLVARSAEVKVLDVEATLMEYLRYVDGRKFLPVIEKFTITTKTAQNTQAPWSLEVIGITRNTIWRECALDLVMQKPDEVMDLMTNPRLRAVECWHRGGAGHANDAIRHAMFALYRRGWRDQRLILTA
jgi:hypothetical protein